MSTGTAEQLLAQLKGLVPQGTAPPTEAQIQQAQDTLRKLKLELVKFHSSPPFSAEELAQVRKVLQLQRDMLESACFLSLYSKDIKAFERYMLQLKTYYNDYQAVLPPSQAQGAILGLYLLCLLAQNQIADFHTEYELMAHAASSVGGAKKSGGAPASPTSRSNVSGNSLLSSDFITFPVALEQQLMEGCYNRILTANQALPLPIYRIFIDTLAETVRHKIADCSELSYESLTVAEVQKLLLLPKPEDAQAFVRNRPGWSVQGSKVTFANKNNNASSDIQAMKTIKQTLEYATELERIV